MDASLFQLDILCDHLGMPGHRRQAMVEIQAAAWLSLNLANEASV